MPSSKSWVHWKKTVILPHRKQELQGYNCPDQLVDFPGVQCSKVWESGGGAVKLPCIIHQEALCARAAQLGDVGKTINLIRSRVLNHREFWAFLMKIDSQYGDIIYHSDVRWLSCGTVSWTASIPGDLKLTLKEKKETALLNWEVLSGWQA